MAQGLFFDLVVVYAMALGLMLLAGRVGIPSVIALIAAGVAAGPAGLGLVAEGAEVEQLADVGVVLLLFTVGLDFPVDALKHIWRTVVTGGALQIAGTAAAVGAIAVGIGLSPRAAVFAGLFVALSSTAIVLKELGRFNRLDSPAGRLTTGVLLFQDLAVVLLLFAAPLLGAGAERASVGSVLGRGAAALVVILVIARLALPVLFRFVTTSRQREAFPLAVLVGSVGTAAIGASLGLSMALGAFLAGLVLSGSEFSHQAHAEIRPLRDVLTSLFFISLGLLLDISAMAEHLPIVIGVAVAAIVVKACVAGGAVIVSGGSKAVTIVTALSLAQVGEFSFVLGRDALALGILPADVWQILLPASILTMLAAPPMIAVAPAWAARLAGSRDAVADAGDPPAERRVFILGFGVGGRLVAAALREFNIPYQIVDLNGATVRDARAHGEPIIYGDATSPDTLIAVGVRHARAVVMVMSDPDASHKVVTTMRAIAPDVPVLVRARYRAEAARLETLGAIAVAEEMEASLEVLAQLLARLDVPGNIVNVLLEDYRRREALPERHKAAPRVPIGELTADLLTQPIATHEVREGDWADGRSLADLSLRAETGVSVFAVRRDGRYTTAPPADFQLVSRDVLYLLGDASDVLLARQRLSAG